MTDHLNDKPQRSANDGKDFQIIEKDDYSNPYNKIISKNVREYHFIVPNNELVEIGEIFFVQDKEKNINFLTRITDIQHASNYDGNWDTIIRGSNFYDNDHIFNRIVGEPLGCIVKEGDEKKFRKSRTIPTKFSRVERAEKEQFQFLVKEMGDIEVGCLRNGSRDVKGIPVALHSNAMDHHMGVFATTGKGKSNFMKVFAASCMKKAALGESKFGLLIVDPHGEYLSGGDVGKKGLLDLEIYMSGGLVCYSSDPRQFKESAYVSELVIGKSDIKPKDIGVLFDWNPTQREALDVIPRAFEKNRNWIDDILTLEGINKMTGEGVHEKTMEKLNKNIRTVLYKNEAIISKDERSSVKGIIEHLKQGKVVLIDIPNLSERSELFILSLISNRILEKYKRNAFDGIRSKGCLITIEEAQRVLGGGEGSIVRFESIAREGRKFGVGLCAITQQPKLIDKQLLSQFNTLVILGLADRNDRTRLEDSAQQDLSSLDVEIQTLEKGEAIISTLNIPFPVPTSIHLYEDYLKELTDKKVDYGD
ncbi:MAG TPA: ATP-binding protein, partial [Alphaproteobacteria bacterium]|nr:ATP-binding protein [Alphaproteobacteria bacterium]